MHRHPVHLDAFDPVSACTLKSLDVIGFQVAVEMVLGFPGFMKGKDQGILVIGM